MQQQDGRAPAAEEGGEEGGKAAAAKAPQPSDPQKVLSKLLTARVRCVIASLPNESVA